MSNYKAVLFDLDGTVLYTLEDILASTNRTLLHFGYGARTSEELRQAVGNGARRQIASLIPQGEENPNFEAAMEFYRRDYPLHCNDQARPYPGILEVLRALQEAGIKTAIVSNKPQDAVTLLWKAHFEGLVSLALGEQPGLPRKPAPDMVALALAKLDVLPEEAVYVGDSEVDIATAKNAGLPCISVTWGYRSHAVLAAAGGQTFCAAPAELISLIC